MSGRRSDRAAPIAAAGQGIGRASAERFFTEGAHVIAIDRDADRLAELGGGTDAARHARRRYDATGQSPRVFLTGGNVVELGVQDAAAQRRVVVASR
ncbi:SDR family NAD(P)-dependent oxidoreductase [Stakelama saccharophila]|uniref:SDR family NAD(P)-dependent oxidoreductase n=1 Tax=Stakelama saccharophila TaxID=3075605 RepID=A0ABZ0B766_9SPHN|nr:SDR family NAD(P)-dependent oxidoreductase [Stakelama sp. W311]WNO52840.1 SDR family NAD(P)-dependent oxidoreductase [Stakelama sp. W311]